MQCDVTRCVICIFDKVGYLNKEHSYKNSTKEVILIVIASDIYNAIKKILDKNSCHRHFNNVSCK